MPFPKYAKKEDIPAGAEDVYEERDGEWHPKLEDVTGLKATVEATRADKRQAEKLLREAEEKRAAAERERDALKTQVGDPDAKVAELLKKFDADVATARAEADKRADAAEAKVRALTLDKQAVDEFVKAGGRPEKAAAALKQYADRLDLSDDRPVVKDGKGVVTTKTLADFFKEEARNEFPEWYNGTKAGGGGAAGINGGRAGASGTPTWEEIMNNPSVGLEAGNASTTS
jgi:hypothetical protein